MKKIGITFLAIFIFIMLFGISYGHEGRSFVGKVEVSDLESRLFSWLVQKVKPDSAYMIIDEPIDDSGKVRHLYFEAVGPKMNNFRISHLKMETMFNDFGPVSNWKIDGPMAVNEVVMGYFDALMTDSDINGFLRNLVVEDKNGSWDKLHIGFIDEGIKAEGYYHVKKPVGVRIKVNLDGELSLKEGDQIWLDKYNFRVNNDDQSSFVEDSIRDIQPIVDMSSFIFPVHLKRLDISSGKMRLTTRVEPKPFDGISLKFSSR